MEQVVRVVRARRRLRMVLHGERGPLAMAEPLARAVVQVDVRRLPAVGLGGRRVHGEPVVLRRDRDLRRREVLHWMVGAVVAELELVGAAAAGEPHDLVAEADAEDRQAPEQRAHRVDQVRHALRIAGAVREEHAVWLPLEDGGRRRRRGHHGDVATRHTELTEDVPLYSAVVGDDREARGGRRHVAARELPAALAPAVGLGGRHLRDEVAADEPRQRARPRQELRGVVSDRRDDPVLGAVVPEVTRERARVDPLDADDAVAAQVVVEARAGAEVRRDGRRLFDDEAVHPRLPRLDVLLVDAVVADERVRHRDDLPSVRRIGEDLLVAGHRGVEDDLAGRLAARAEGLARERAAVAQDEDRARHGRTAFPPTIVSHGAPVSIQPAKGVFRLFERNLAGSTIVLRSRSRIVTSAGAPGARLPPGRLRSLAGSRERRETSVGSGRSPGLTSRSSSTATAVSRPTTPNAAWSNSPSFSASAWGAWSVATQSIVPSARASTSASTSRFVRSGGAILVFGS